MSKNKGGLADKKLLHALLPGAKVENESNRKISVDFGFCREIVHFNIGGTLFQTYRSTLHKQPNSPLADDNFLKKNYRPETRDYFFDRDPDVFKAILNYLRTGSLHIPSYICGPAVKEELQFWGIEDHTIERCCWTHYNSWNATLEALNQLERDRKGSYLNEDVDNNKTSTCWGKWQPKIWNLLNRPTSSKLAKFYGWFSLFFVIVSITSFVIETHPVFSYTVFIPDTTSSQPTGSNYSLESNGSKSSNDTASVQGKTMTTSHPAFYYIDLVCLSLFTVEYISRVIFARKKIRYMTSLMGVIDLAAILPDYIQFIVYAFHPEYRYDGNVDYIAVLRIARVLRVFRLIRHVPGLWILIYTLRSSLQELLLMAVFMVVGMLVFSSLVYFADDHEVFKSIPHSFWWALVTMTTVGYGDMVPKTPWGYVVGSVTAVSGLLMIGFSVPVLVNNFIMYYKHVQFIVEGEYIDSMKTSNRDSEVECHEMQRKNELSPLDEFQTGDNNGNIRGST